MFEKSNKTTTIQFRVTAEEKEILKKIANEKGCTISDFIKFCIKKELNNKKEV